jgi:hypothetical protein
MYTQTFHWFWDDFATTDETSGYKIAITLPSGYLWHFTEFGVNAGTNYAAQDTNYQTFYLKDSSGNTIASVANGASSGGLAIGPAVVTGVDTAMDTSYDDIDCSSANKTVYVTTAATGAGRAMVKIHGWVKAIPYRP